MIPFSPPYIDDLIISEVTAALKSGWITTGPRTKLFEKQIAAYCNVDHVLCLNSATAGLEIMLRWFGVKEGDEVILPAYTYSATANVIIHCGATPVFVDSGNDFNIDPEKIAAAITPRTKVIMPVDFAGLPCNYDRIKEIVSANTTQFVANNEIQSALGRILILSDAAHSFGASVNNIKTGTLADLTVFSFHAVKNLTTAEGGAICFNLPQPFNNAEVYAALCIKTLHGQNKDALAKTQKGNWRYDIVEAGYKMNMTDIHAAIGIAQLTKYDSWMLPRRKEIFNTYNKLLMDCNWAILPVAEVGTTIGCYHLYPLRIKGITLEQRDEIIQHIFNLDVSVNVHFIPVPTMSYYRNLGYNGSDYPIAMQLSDSEISLPLHTQLSEEDIQTVIQAVRKAVTMVRPDLD